MATANGEREPALVAMIVIGAVGVLGSGACFIVHAIPAALVLVAACFLVEVAVLAFVLFRRSPTGGGQ